MTDLHAALIRAATVFERFESNAHRAARREEERGDPDRRAGALRAESHAWGLYRTAALRGFALDLAGAPEPPEEARPALAAARAAGKVWSPSSGAFPPVPA